MGTIKSGEDDMPVLNMNAYPKNIYPASADPMHFSHRTTLFEAEKQLGEEVHLLICLNDMKSKGVFSTEERLRLAQIMLPRRRIYVAASNKEVREYFRQCDRFVRGIRGIEDEEEIERLVKHYNLEAESSKLVKVKVAANFRDISSTRLKALVASGDISSAEQFTCPEIVRALHEQYLRQNHETTRTHERELCETIQSRKPHVDEAKALQCFFNSDGNKLHRMLPV